MCQEKSTLLLLYSAVLTWLEKLAAARLKLQPADTFVFKHESSDVQFAVSAAKSILTFLTMSIARRRSKTNMAIDNSRNMIIGASPTTRVGQRWTCQYTAQQYCSNAEMS